MGIRVGKGMGDFYDKATEQNEKKDLDFDLPVLRSMLVAMLSHRMDPDRKRRGLFQDGSRAAEAGYACGSEAGNDL